VSSSSTPTRSWSLADLVPAWVRSIRFRLAAIYTLALVGVAGLLLLVLYLGFEQVLAAQAPSGTPSLEAELLRLLGLADVFGFGDAATDAAAAIREQVLTDLRNVSISALVVLVPLAFLVGWLVAGRVLRPVDRITAVAREIGSTDLSRRIHLDGPNDEVRRMADTFDAMLDRLDDGARAQRTFVEDASHELRNPLAVIRTTLDVALADPDDVEGLRKAAEVALRTADRMSTTVDELLAFARHGGRLQPSGPVDLGAVVEQVAQEYEAVAATSGVTLVASAEPGLVVEGDRDALKRAQANLVSNAVRVAPSGSTIHCGAGRVPGWRWFGVRDTGPGIDPSQQPLVFQRAWREGGRAIDGEGRGLGLALVRQIAEAHGGTVSVASAPGAGASFVVWLPERAGVGGPSVDDLRQHPDPLWAVGLPR
jgi:signal transduction histidine kinase